jgi:hypothetical protein
MTDSLLLKSQRNEVFQAIQESGIEVASFSWVRWASVWTRDLIVSRLKHDPTEGYFHFDLQQGKHWCRFSPGNEKAIDEGYPGSWPGQLAYVGRWLGYLKREFTATDLWAVLSGESTLVSAGSSATADNRPFTPAERSRVAQSLAEIRAFLISAHQVNEQSVRLIDERLKYLEEASERLGRKDWLNVAFSVIANIVVGAALAPEAARNVLNLAGTLLGWILGGTPILPNPLL